LTSLKTALVEMPEMIPTQIPATIVFGIASLGRA
jgi:hypothetical protein